MTIQARGFAGRLIFDWEDTFKTVRAVGARRPLRLFYNRVTVGEQQPLEQPTTLIGKRFEVEPFKRFKNLQGDLVLPLDADQMLYFLRAGVGAPVIRETYAGNRNIGGTLTIAAEGAGTFSAAQINAAVGDRVIYEKDGVRYQAFLEVKTSDTVWTLALERAGTTDPATISAATVVAIVKNRLSATPGTVTIVDGVATFSQAQGTNVVAGCQVLVDITNGMKRYFIGEKTSTTVFTLVDGEGFPAPDGEALACEAIEAPTLFDHTFRVHETDALPSFVLARDRMDLKPIVSAVARGCKVNTLGINLGGDSELVATMGILGAAEDRGSLPYDVTDIAVYDDGYLGVDIDEEGEATFDYAQEDGAQVGDVVIYRAGDWVAGDPVYWAIITDRTSDTVMQLADGDGQAAGEITGATVLGIYTPGEYYVSWFTKDGRFEQFDWTLYVSEVAAADLSQFNLNVDNQMDTNVYTVNEGGTRRGLPELMSRVSGTLEALMVDDTLIAIASEEGTPSLRAIGVNGDNQFEITIPQVRFERPSDAIEGPGGTRLTVNWMAFVDDDNSEGSPVVVRVRSARAIGAVVL